MKMLLWPDSWFEVVSLRFIFITAEVKSSNFIIRNNSDAAQEIMDLMLWFDRLVGTGYLIVPIRRKISS